MKKIVLAAGLFFSTAQLLLANTGNTLNPCLSVTTITDTTFKIFSLSKAGYGFDILAGKKILIHQPFIPAVQGSYPFIKKADAEKVAKLMLSKLKRNQMPPTISVQELDSLHIVHH